MTKYEKGRRYRVLKPASLTMKVPKGAYAWGFESEKLAVGTIVESRGYEYSGGSDGIHLPVFVSVDAEGEARTLAGEFSPSSWGSPLPEWLEELDVGA